MTKPASADHNVTLLSDLGNVLIDVDRAIALQPLADRLHISADLLRPYFEEHPLHHELELGQITPEDFLNTVTTELPTDSTIDLELLRRILGQSFSVNTPTVEAIDGFRDRCQVIILSNTNAIDIPYIEGEFGMISWADDDILSYEVGLRKPDPAIYEHAIETYSLNPERTLFIDDKSENITAANHCGLNGYIYQSASQVWQILSEALIQ